MKLFKIETKRRNEIADFYLKNLCNQLELPQKQKNKYSVWSQFTIRTKRRNSLKEYLINKKIPTMIYYPKPIHKQKAYQKFYSFNNSLKNCVRASKEVLSLPIHGYLCNEQIEYIVQTINDFFKK